MSRKKNDRGEIPHRKGYKNLIDALPPAIPWAAKGSSASDYQKPHRKPLMETIFNKDMKRRQRLARNIAIATASLAPAESPQQPMLGDIVLGVDLRVRRVYQNPVAGAMDQPYLPNSKTRALRPPIPVPPRYLARLKDLEHIKKQLDQKERELATFEEKIEKSALKLKFDDSVQQDGDRYLKANPFASSQAKLPAKAHQPIAPISSPSPDQSQDQHVDFSLPESLTLQSIGTEELELNSLEEQSIQEMDADVSSMIATRPVTTEPTSTSIRNVEYMLSIWERAEGHQFISKTIKDPHFRPSETLRRALLLTSGHSSSPEPNKLASTQRGRPSLIPMERIDFRPITSMSSRSAKVQDIIEEDEASVSHRADTETTDSSRTSMSNSSKESGQEESITSTKENNSKEQLLSVNALQPEHPMFSQLQDVNGTLSISHSTLRILNRLSRENQFMIDNSPASHGVASFGTTPRTSDSVSIKRILTGVNPETGETMDDPFSIDPGLHLDAAISSSFTDLHLPVIQVTTRSSRDDKLRPRSSLKRGRWLQQIESLVQDTDEKSLAIADVDSLEMKTIMTPNQPSKTPIFKLELPDEPVDDISTDAGSVTEEKIRGTAHHDVAEHHSDGKPSDDDTADDIVDEFGIPTRNAREGTKMISEKLKDLFGKHVIIPSSLKGPVDWTSIFKPVKLKQAPGVPRQSMVLKEREVFDLTRFLGLAKTATHHHPSEAVKLHSIKDMKKQYQINSLVDFIDSPYSAIVDIPAPESFARKGLVRALTFGLREEKDTLLQFESCRLIIVMNAQSEIGRWDTLVLKKVMDQMIKKGNDAEREAAALAFVQTGTLNVDIASEVFRGVGSEDEVKRNAAMDAIALLDAMHHPIIIEKLMTCMSHSSWKVRLDAIELLEIWVNKLMPPPAPPRPARDPDALETDDEETIKALFHTLANDSSSDSQDKAFLDLDASLMDMEMSIDGIVSLEPVKHAGLNEAGALSVPSAEEGRVSKAANGVAATEWPKEIIQEREKIIQRCVDVLLEAMWNDWHASVREEAAATLGRLKQGKPIFDWIVRMLSSSDPVKRVDALRSLTYLGVMTAESMSIFRECFRDAYANVRIEACKVACVLKSNDRTLLNDLFDLLNDYDHRVRAYAIKALGHCQSKEPKTLETLIWALHHDKHPAVRAEAIRAVYNLGLVTENQSVREGIFTVAETDKSNIVRKEAERVLVTCNLIFNMGDLSDQARREVNIASRMVNNGGTAAGPYPHLLSGRPPSEADVFLRDSLVGEKELTTVIQEVRGLANKDEVMSQIRHVLRSRDNGNEVDIDYVFNSEFIPDRPAPVRKQLLQRRKILNDQEYKLLTSSRGKKVLSIA